ncbi:MAG TPA: hypothetical protein VGE07_09705 [Herpetosiphonaceae bacterium]
MPVALLLAALGCAPGAGGGERPGAPSQAPAAGRAEAERFIGAPLPADAEELRIANESGIDDAYYIGFAAPPDSVTAFVRDLGLPAPKPGVNPFPAALDPGLDWWAPADAGQFQGGSHLAGNGKSYEILVDTGAAERWQVFLRVFSL